MTFLDITVKILCDRKKIAGMIKFLVCLMDFSFSALTSTSPSQDFVKQINFLPNSNKHTVLRNYTDIC